jgi:ribosome biogenesis GTPase A
MSGKKNVLPSHMKRALDRLEQLSGVVNLVIEAVDARAPRATRCDFITKTIGGCRTATVLTKTDLADPGATKAWLAEFRREGRPAVTFAARENANRDAFIRALLAAAGDTGPSGARAVVAGLPNVGKSTITNFLIGRRSARVGAMPGVTRGLQLIKLRDDFLLLDTPGIVSPRLARREEGLILALAGCLQENLYDQEEAAFKLLQMSLPEYEKTFFSFYGIKETGGEPGEPAAFCEALAIRRGFLRKGGEPDLDRACKTLVRDFSTGRISGITLERPDVRSAKK